MMGKMSGCVVDGGGRLWVEDLGRIPTNGICCHFLGKWLHGWYLGHKISMYIKAFMA